MPFEPPPLNLNNTSIGAAGQAAAAASSIYNGVMAARNQQAQRADVDRREGLAAQLAAQQREFQDQMEARKNGYVPAEEYTGGLFHPQLGRPTLQTGQPVGDGKGGGPLAITTPGGTRMVKPPEQPDAGFVPTGHLAEALEAAGHKRGTPIKPADAHTILQTLNELQPRDEPWDLDTSGKFTDAGGNPVPVMIGKKSGQVKMLGMGGLVSQAQKQGALPPGTEIPTADGAQPGTGSGAIRFGVPPSKEPTPKALRWEKNENDSGDVHLRAFDEAGTPVREFVYPGEGKKRKDPDATPGDDQLSAKQRRMVASQLVSANKVKNTRMVAAEKQFTADLRDAKVVDPKSPQAINYDSGKLQAAKDKLLREKQSAQDEYEDALGQFGQRVGHVTLSDNADGAQGEPAPAPPAKGQQRKPLSAIFGQ